MTKTYNNYSQWDDWKKSCHTGNTKIYTEPSGGSMYIGGWNQGATFNLNTHVIDLTGNELSRIDMPVAMDVQSEAFMPYLWRGYAGWLSLPFPDYNVPHKLNTYQQWLGIAETIKNILIKGNDVLVACHGGHGRSGLFCAIVGYILGHESNDKWDSPVEYVRSLHCEDAVETFAQEKFVYDILGLRIQIRREYETPKPTTKEWKETKKCPICGTLSSFVTDYGMCMGCKTKFAAIAPERENLTLEDIKDGGLVEHTCDNEHCVGIWKASLCGHTTHDMIVYDGLCQVCADRMESEKKIVDAVKDDQKCAICQNQTTYSEIYGVCYECAEYLDTHGVADKIHNSITDGYKAVEHYCNENVLCVGIAIADVCGHVVHNREIEDGLCPACFDSRHTKEEK